MAELAPPSHNTIKQHFTPVLLGLTLRSGAGSLKTNNNNDGQHAIKAISFEVGKSNPNQNWMSEVNNIYTPVEWTFECFLFILFLPHWNYVPFFSNTGKFLQFRTDKSCIFIWSFSFIHEECFCPLDKQRNICVCIKWLFPRKMYMQTYSNTSQTSFWNAKTVFANK